ncbi:GDP-mannose 4,6-dehydratase [Patescibacteria group bacterium]|nr:GDP-mannose 4,6-dehydratase [Patescibacteria group bacterium]
MEIKKALITGITGQDGSYLTELLLEKGYEVHGMVRRGSTINTVRIDKPLAEGKILLHYGDLTDVNSIVSILTKVKPDEIYNLGAMSHVKVSFDVPEYTGQTTGLGSVRILEALRSLGMTHVKYYQASSSEMFGISPPPQNEETIFRPQSPYGCAKLYSYWITKTYRKAYGMFACNGILFNHETIASFMPMFCKNNDEEEFDIKPIREIVSFDETKKCYQSKKVEGLQVWGKEGWVDVRFASAYPHNIKKDNKHPRFINSRSGAFMATGSHVGFLKDNSEKEVRDMEVGDQLEVVRLPEPSNKANYLVSKEEAELIGVIVGDGSITYAKKGSGLHGKFTNSSETVREYFSHLWSDVTGGSTSYYPSKSGFNPKKIVGQLRLIGGNDWLRKIDIYNNDKTKRIPKIILNSSPEIMTSFLEGYNVADGLKKNPCIYEFKNFKTNSATLAMGLWYLIDKTTGQDVNLTLEEKDDGRIFYSLNMLTTTDSLLKETKVKDLMKTNLSQRGICRKTKISRTFIRKIQLGGSCCLVHHLRKDPLEVKKIIDMPEHKGWFYDLETSSGEFHCGIGKCHVHNSPRRGETFVTKKIVRSAVRIKLGLQNKICLGNLKAKRDWGFAGDYMEAIYKIMHHDKPDDFIVATKEHHTIEEFAQKVFKKLGLKFEDYLEVSDQYFRPNEVPDLMGDATKIKTVLGWEPKVKFDELIDMMIQETLKEENAKLKGNS